MLDPSRRVCSTTANLGGLGQGSRLSVGVVGHRPDKLQDEAAIAARLADILPRLQATAEALEQALELRTSMAAGADLLAVSAAAGAGIPVRLIVAGTLNALRLEIVGEGAAWQGHFDAARGHATDVEELEACGERRHAVVADHILAHSHALLAIWDGGPGRGEGGTADSIKRAQERGMPVLWLDTRDRMLTLLSPDAPLPQTLACWLAALVAEDVVFAAGKGRNGIAG